MLKYFVGGALTRASVLQGTLLFGNDLNSDKPELLASYFKVVLLGVLGAHRFLGLFFISFYMKLEA